MGLGSKIISTNPLIVSQDGLFGGTSYYWIKGGKKYVKNLLVAASGYIKVTSKTKKYSGITCSVANGKKVTANPLKYKNKIDKLKTKKGNINNALKNSFWKPNEDVVRYVGVADSSKPCGLYYSEKYTKIKWTSSDNSVASVDSKGCITGKKIGRAVIKAQASISGKSASFNVIVKDDITVKDEKGLLTKEQFNYDGRGYNLCLDINQVDKIWGEYNANAAKVGDIKFSCDSSNVISVSNDGTIKAIGSGYATIQIEAPYAGEACYFVFVTVSSEQSENYDDDEE